MKYLKIFIFAIVTLLLTACGFAPRQASHVPPQLRVLYLDTPNPYSPLTVQLQRTLQSIDIHFVDNIQEAPVTLYIKSNNFNYQVPTILDSGDAITYRYTISVTYQLEKPNGVSITPPKTITVTRSLIQNANQVYTPDATELMKREVTRTAVILLYHDLMSLKMQRALQTAFKHSLKKRKKH